MYDDDETLPELKTTQAFLIRGVVLSVPPRDSYPKPRLGFVYKGLWFGKLREIERPGGMGQSEPDGSGGFEYRINGKAPNEAGEFLARVIFDSRVVAECPAKIIQSV